MMTPTLEGEDNDAKTSILVHLTIYETSACNGTQERSITDCSTVDIETSMRKGGRVSDLKSVLESQDVIPENVDEEFILEVRLRTTDTSCLQDFHIIQESVKEIYVTLKPKCIFSVQPPSSTLQPTSPQLSAYSDLPQQRTAESLSPPLSLLMNNVLRVAPHPTQLFNLNESSLNHQDSLSEMMLTDPALLQQMMNSTVMRSLMSNSTVLRTILESNPQIRQLRERHPELNHLLNDSELLQQSMQAMQNPGLMREMISNTDRVLNNIDAIPGGYNALRRVYQSIQEPIWDVSFGCGSSQSETDCQPRDYNLERSGPPSTETIPNPWASPPPTSRQTQTTVPTIATACVNQHRSSARTTPSTTPLHNMCHTTNTTATVRPTAESHVTSEPPQQGDTQPVSMTRPITSPHPRAEDPQTSATLNVTTTASVSLSPTPPDALTITGVQKSETIQEPKSSATIHQEKTNTEAPEQENPVQTNPSTTSSSLPFFYPPLFTPNRGLRSLGGLTLPVHIQGVIRPSPSKEDEEPIENPRLPKTDHEDNEH